MATDIESTGGISDHLAYALNHNNQDKRNSKAYDDREKKTGGIRVYKKSSLNSKITVYLGRRDFVDHISHVDPIDGVVLIDRDYVQNRKVFGHVLATFRYGREDLDVLGLTFRKELYLVNEQIFPQPEPKQIIQKESSSANPPNDDVDMPQAASVSDGNNTTVNTPASIWQTGKPKPSSYPRPLTRLQERLLKKLGPNAFPFFFELPPLCPASVTLQPGPGDTGKPCGVDYELKAYVADAIDEKPHKRDSVRLAIRKIMYAPSRQGEQPSVEVTKDFVMSPNKLNLEASLDKELYHHGESIAVNVHIANNSNRTVKKIKVSVRQFADICLFSAAQYKCTVADLESEEGCPIGPGFTLSKVYYLRPLLANNKDKRGLALDGQLKHEDTNLASSTLVTDPAQRENLGIVVQYRVRVKLCLGPLGGELTAELPFTLMHPKPYELEDFPDKEHSSSNHAGSTLMNIEGEEQNQDGTSKERNNEGDLIQLDDDTDDIIFEDFARLRLEQAGDFQPSMDAF
ncbi:Beta-arrestin-1, partial [Fragariocoptes setiger]